MREKGEQLLSAWAQDYAAAKRGESDVLTDGPAADGRVFLHGRHRSGICAAVYVHPSGAVAPVLAGAHDRCFDACLAAQEGEIDVADCRRCPLPAVRIDGIDRHFRQVTGRRVVGAIEHGEAVVLLGFVGSCWAVACLEAGRAEWLATSGRIGLVDLDLWRELHAPLPSGPEPQVPAEPPPVPSPARPEPHTSVAPTPPAPSPARPETQAATPPAASSPAPPALQAPVPVPAPAPPPARPEPPAPAPPSARSEPQALAPPPPGASPTPSTPAAPPSASPPDPELLAILGLHKRLLGIDVGNEKAALGRVLVRGLEIHVGRVPPGRRRELLEALARGIVALGSRVLYEDPRGTKSQLASSFEQSLGQPVSPRELGEALLVARDEGWDFITLSERTWTIHLGELLDIRSPLHLRFVQRCIPTFDLRGVEPVDGPPQTAGPAANEPPVDRRLMQTLLVAVVMLASAGRKHGPELADRDRQLAAVRSERDALAANLADRDAQLGAVKAERDKAQVDLADRDGKLAAIRITVMAQDERLVALQADLGEAQTRLADRDTQLAALQGAAYAERDQADRNGLLAAQLAVVQEDLTEARSRLADREEQLAALAALQADARLAVAQAELGQARTGRDTRLAEALTERDDARQMLVVRDAELVALQAERDEARHQLADRDAEVASLRRELTLQAEQSSRLEARIVRLEATRASLFAPWSAAPGDLNAARTSLSAQASALPHPTPSGTTTPRGGRGPPGGAGPR